MKCQCEMSLHPHGCVNSAIVTVYFPGSGTYELCSYCVKEYQEAGYD